MVEFDIDTKSISGDYNLSRKEIDNLLQTAVEDLCDEFAYLWQREAKRVLGSTRNSYIESIQVGKKGRFTGVVFLNPANWLANAIEMGVSSFDMKKGFLASDKVTIGKNGPYITIPFRFSTTNLGESPAFAGNMPPEIKKKVKEQSILKLKDIPPQYKASQALVQKQESISFRKRQQVQEKSIYEGLHKRGGGYMNFRRVSLNSPESSWTHPGFEAKNIAIKALGKLDIQQVLKTSLDEFLAKL